jgi:FAD/FMN-containing dehydrogenase/Fe-S oxidoreductase
METKLPWHELRKRLEGNVQTDHLHAMLYATDASIYRRLPSAVIYPKSVRDIQNVLQFAGVYHLPVVPRTAGTSLAGQVVGHGIILDVSRFMTSVQEYDICEQWVRVQPGVIRDELNLFLRPFGFFFGPNTSTSNRCMIGGMIGNNSCGSTSIKYGTTRDHVLELEVVLSDGSRAVIDREGIHPLDENPFAEDVERKMRELIEEKGNQEVIRNNFPKKSITRRNTGYALDFLLNSYESGEYDLTKLICGSEGTLAIVTSAKLHVNRLPPSNIALLTPHFESVGDALKAVQIAMRHDIYACELMDDVILNCTKGLPKFEKQRAFVVGEPKAILMIECRSEDVQNAMDQAKRIAAEMKKEGFGFAFPILQGDTSEDAWNLRKSGLGLLANIPGKKKAVACIEDTAVALADLPSYIAEFSTLMESFGQRAVYYAHAGAGELHLRPILDLKSDEGKRQLKKISKSSAQLVAKYGGSLSGEHGDGVVRAGHIKDVMGDETVELFRKVKSIWDPGGLLNPGKIIDPWPIDEFLRYENPENGHSDMKSALDFGEEGILGIAEKCNGSGDCRRSESSGGVMCPSYMATRDEIHSTRARANVLREMILHPTNGNPMTSKELDEVMDLCISCKGCTRECPSGVDMSALKSEYLYQKYKSSKRPLRDRMIATSFRYDPIISKLSWIYGPLSRSQLFKKVQSSILSIHSGRTLPVAKEGFFQWLKKQHKSSDRKLGTVHLYIDEFSAYQDAHIAKSAYSLLSKLGYEIFCHKGLSGRTYISKGFLKEAAHIAEKEVKKFHAIVSDTEPLVGIEPSAILGFRDEIPRLLRGKQQEMAGELRTYVLTIEEFLAREIRRGQIAPVKFDDKRRKILYHGHCHQKALSGEEDALQLLSMPEGHVVERVPSGCCGMAGSFGYEKEHYDISMKIGELVLFPAIRKKGEEVFIVTSGTSCRHQIKDGTGRVAVHPVELMERCLKY